MCIPFSFLLCVNVCECGKNTGSSPTTITFYDTVLLGFFCGKDEIPIKEKNNDKVCEYYGNFVILLFQDC
jgi:hypothetical protein